MTRIITSLKECEHLWKKWNGLLGHKGFFDLWAVRMCLFDSTRFTPHFILGDNESWLVPLWFDKKRELYEFFGGELPEPNHIFINPTHASTISLRAVTDHLPAWTYLEYLDTAPESLPGLVLMDEHDRYVLKTRGLSSFEDYLSTFSGKHRKNLQRDLRLVDAKVTRRHGNIQDLTKLASLNRTRFGTHSSFHNPDEENGFMRVCDFAHKKGWLHIHALAQGERIIAVQPAVLYNHTYTVFSGGADLRVQNSGKLLLALHIKNALAHDAALIDFMSHDSGWKKLWNLQAISQYEYTNEDESERMEKEHLLKK